MSTPAGDSGGDTTTPTTTALPELPDKIRIHALAKLLERSSREVLAALTELGADARSAQSSIDRGVAVKVIEALVGTPPGAQAGESAEAEAPAKGAPPAPVFASASPLFLPPDPAMAKPAPARDDGGARVAETAADATEEAGEEDDEGARPRRRRGRRGRGRGKGGQGDEAAAEEQSEDEQAGGKQAGGKQAGGKQAGGKQAKGQAAADKDTAEDADAEQEGAEDSEDADGTTRRRRRRRRRKGGDDEGGTGEDDPPNTVVHVREAREEKAETSRDEVRSVRGSTRLEAKRQRRRDGREAGRRRAPILSEAEFLARREAVDRAMVVRERDGRTQIGVLEDGVLVEHFVTSSGSASLVGNVYLGRVQNVLPSMEAAFVDIGRGRNAVLYAGEVDWDAAGLEGKARKIEQALNTGDSVLVQVTKDPVGHKGARLTTQISLPGRFLVYVPGGGATGISRKLPENERRRLKDVLKRVVPEDAGVIIRTASEGVSEDELARDVRRLQAQWQIIRDKTEGANGVKKANAPALLYEEPDLLVKVVRDLFTEDFSALVVEGDEAWDTIEAYVRHVAPELTGRLRRHVAKNDVFTEYRIEEQLLKALDRKVWLPSGGYLVIDRTEAMTVIDVNTGKFTGSGGNLEETVTRNNLESAEEIVRQLRLRDIGGIIVIDFIDMVLESNRDLVLRRLTECLGRDRTRHQVAEVTSLGLVQMTRKRVGTGLLEAFSSTCEHCKGRGVLVSTEPLVKAGGGNGQSQGQQGGGGGRRSRGRGGDDGGKAGKDSGKDGGKDGGKDKDVVRVSPQSEAAAQAAKEAVRGIAMATTKGGDKPAGDGPVEAKPAEQPVEPVAAAVGESEPEVVAAPEPAAEVVAAPAAEPEAAVAVAESETPQPAEVVEQAEVAQAAEKSESTEATETVTEPEQDDGALVPARRRAGRRAASRPAGPPMTA